MGLYAVADNFFFCGENRVAQFGNRHLPKRLRGGRSCKSIKNCSNPHLACTVTSGHSHYPRRQMTNAYTEWKQSTKPLVYDARECISFKLCLRVYTAIHAFHGLAPCYLNEMCVSHNHPRVLTLAMLLRLINCRFIIYYCCYSPDSAIALAVFRQRLKTFLFSRSYQDTIIWLGVLLSPFTTTVWTPVVLAIINII